MILPYFHYCPIICPLRSSHSSGKSACFYSVRQIIEKNGQFSVNHQFCCSIYKFYIMDHLSIAAIAFLHSTRWGLNHRRAIQAIFHLAGKPPIEGRKFMGKSEENIWWNSLMERGFMAGHNDQNLESSKFTVKSTTQKSGRPFTKSWVVAMETDIHQP